MPKPYEYIILYVVMCDACCNHCNEIREGNAMVDWKEEIATTLKNEAAKLPPNSRFYPIRKMMTRFNTSQRTIEQVMEQLVAENVMVRRRGDGYFTRNQSPNRLLHYRLVYPKWPSEWFQTLETAWQSYAEQTQKFSFSSMSIGQCNDFFKVLPVDNSDVLLVIPPAGPINREAIQHISQLSVPVVLFDHEVGDLELSMVTCDPIGGAEAASYLIRHGHRDLAILIAEPHGDGFDMRCRAFCDYAQLAGAKVKVLDVNCQNWNPGTYRAYEILNRYLDEYGLDFTGIFLASSSGVLEVYKAFANHNIAIPEDVSIVAHDETASNRLMHPSLTSLDPEWNKMVSQIHQNIIEIIAGKQAYFHIRTKPKLIERNSVRRLSESEHSDALFRKKIDA